MTKFESKNKMFDDMYDTIEDGYCDASDFRSDQVGLCVSSDENFSQISLILDDLGFRVNRSKCLDDLFASVSEDPEKTGMIIIFADQNNGGILESHFRLLKMMDYCLPVLILTCDPGIGPSAHVKKIYSDCVHDFKDATSILSKQIYSAVHASLAWAARVDSMNASSIKFLEKKYMKHWKN